MSVYIDRSLGSRCVYTTGPGNVVDQGHHNTEVPELLHKVVHVVGVGKRNIIHARRVFVLWLEENDGPAISDLRFSNYWCNRLNVVL